MITGRVIRGGRLIGVQLHVFCGWFWSGKLYFSLFWVRADQNSLFKFFRHSGVPGGKQSPVTVGAGYQGDPSAMANRPLAELCKLLLLFE